MTLDLNTIHLFRAGYGLPGRCTASDSFYAKDYKSARGIATSRCANWERVISLEKVEQRKTSTIIN